MCDHNLWQAEYNNEKGSLNAESHVSGKELEDGKFLILTSEDGGDQLIFLILLRSCVLQWETGIFHALRVLNKGILSANRGWTYYFH